MATQQQVKMAVQNGGGEFSAQRNTLETLLKSVSIKSRFEEMLGKKSAGFISSILSVANQNNTLKTADPITIISAAAVAASLDLPINPSLGFAHIVPYRDNQTGKVIAQFQMGWKGFVQLAMRSGQYKTMAVSPVYEGELISSNPFTGEYVFSHEAKKSDVVIGYVAYFKLLNGFEKYYYMTEEQVNAHGKKYSKSFANGNWKNNPGPMKMKTVIKMLLSKFGILSIDMQRAIETDQAVIKEDGTPDYLDNGNSVIDSETVGSSTEVDAKEESRGPIGADGKEIEL